MYTCRTRLSTCVPFKKPVVRLITIVSSIRLSSKALTLNTLKMNTSRLLSTTDYTKEGTLPNQTSLTLRLPSAPALAQHPSQSCVSVRCPSLQRRAYRCHLHHLYRGPSERHLRHSHRRYLASSSGTRRHQPLQNLSLPPCLVMILGELRC